MVESPFAPENDHIRAPVNPPRRSAGVAMRALDPANNPPAPRRRPDRLKTPPEFRPSPGCWSHPRPQLDALDERGARGVAGQPGLGDDPLWHEQPGHVLERIAPRPSARPAPADDDLGGIVGDAIRIGSRCSGEADR